MSKMPAIFIGHGSPMNAIENNEYTRAWRNIAEKIPKPKGILVVSAHWFTEGTRITDSPHPKMIYDMYGFPKELYEIVYNSPGAPELARETMVLITKEIMIDNSWGYDHGAWSVLHVMYPDADIPVYQLSINSKASPEVHYQIGQDLKSLREKGILILGSGNIVHDLAKINWDMEGGYDWAYEFDNYIHDKIMNKQYADVIDYHKAGECARLAFRTPEHFYPLLYILGVLGEVDHASVYNHSCLMGSMSMTSYLFE